MSGGMQRLEAQVTGRVQGVGFRHFVRSQARRLGVDGWVRNETDGSVRVVAEGAREALDDLLKRLEEGPAGARVLDVRSDRFEASGEFSGFTVRFF